MFEIIIGNLIKIGYATEAHKERVRNYEAGGTGTYPIRVRHFGGHFPGGTAHDR